MKKLCIGEVIYFYDELFKMIRKATVTVISISCTTNSIENKTYVIDTQYRTHKINNEKCYYTLKELEEDYKGKINKEINKQYLKLNDINNALNNYKG